MKRTFEKGETYFLVLYYDREFKIPRVQTYIFIGTHIFGSEEKNYWCFQEPRSYLKKGPATLESENSSDELMVLEEDGLEAMLDLKMLVQELSGFLNDA